MTEIDQGVSRTPVNSQYALISWKVIGLTTVPIARVPAMSMKHAQIC